MDDEPTLRLGFAYALSNRTTIVETAANGRLALERMETARFDIMILDLRMPEMDGINVIEKLRADGNNIPVVLCSAMLNPNAALRAIRQGVVDFLLKPVRPADLREIIAFVMQPGQLPLPLSMKAARGRQREEAIRILENVPAPTRQMSCWLEILRSIQNLEQAGDVLSLEEKVRTDLSTLAFNAPLD